MAQVKLDPAENGSLLAPLLDIPLPKERTSTFTAEELRRRQLAALTNWVMAGAKVQSVVLAFEDLHWADPTTLDVLRSIADRGALAPLFIVATTRPEFRLPWSMRSHRRHHFACAARSRAGARHGGGAFRGARDQNRPHRHRRLWAFPLRRIRPEDQGQVGRYGNAEVLGKTKGQVAIALRIKDRERAFERKRAHLQNFQQTSPWHR